MKLLTHNMLQCHIKGVKDGYPFKIEAEKVEERPADYDPDFLRHIFPRIQWKALREAASSMGKRAAALASPATMPQAGSRARCRATLLPWPGVSKAGVATQFSASLGCPQRHPHCKALLSIDCRGEQPARDGVRRAAARRGLFKGFPPRTAGSAPGGGFADLPRNRAEIPSEPGHPKPAASRGRSLR